MTMMDLKQWNGFGCTEDVKVVADVRGVSQRLGAQEMTTGDYLYRGKKL